MKRLYKIYHDCNDYGQAQGLVRDIALSSDFMALKKKVMKDVGSGYCAVQQTTIEDMQKELRWHKKKVNALTAVLRKAIKLVEKE